MDELDLLRLREQKEAAQAALQTTITTAQRVRLNVIISKINEEIKFAHMLNRSLLLSDTKVI